MAFFSYTHIFLNQFRNNRIKNIFKFLKVPIVARAVVRNFLHVEHVYPNMDVVGVMKALFVYQVVNQVLKIKYRIVKIGSFITVTQLKIDLVEALAQTILEKPNVNHLAVKTLIQLSDVNIVQIMKIVSIIITTVIVKHGM